MGFSDGFNRAFGNYMEAQSLKRQQQMDELTRQKFDYQKQRDHLEQVRLAKVHEQGILENQQDEDQRAKQWQKEAQGDITARLELLGTEMTRFTNTRRNADGSIEKFFDPNRAIATSGVRDELENILITDERIQNYAKERNPDVEGIDGIDWIDVERDDGHISKQAAIMLRMKDGSLKPMSISGGMNDEVAAMTPDQMFRFAFRANGIPYSPDGMADYQQVMDAGDNTGAAPTNLASVGQTSQQQQTTGTQEQERTPPVEATTPTLRDPLPEELAPEGTVTVSAIEEDEVEPAQTSADIVADLVDNVTDQYSQNIQSLAGHTSNEAAIEKKLLQDVMAATGMVEIDAQKAIQNYRSPTERNDSLATNIGQGARNVVNAAVDVGQWADDQITTDNGRRKQMTDFVDEVVEGYKGADDAVKAGGDANKPAVDKPTTPTEEVAIEAEQENKPATQEEASQAIKQVVQTTNGETKGRAAGTKYERARQLFNLQQIYGIKFNREEEIQYVNHKRLSAPKAKEIKETYKIETASGQWIYTVFDDATISGVNVGKTPKTATEKKAANEAMYDAALVHSGLQTKGDDAPVVASKYKGYLTTFGQVHSNMIKQVFNVDPSSTELDAGDRAILTAVYAEALEQGGRSGFNEDGMFKNKSLDISAVIAGFHDRMGSNWYVTGTQDNPQVINAKIRAERVVALAKKQGDKLDYNKALEKEKAKLAKQQIQYTASAE